MALRFRKSIKIAPGVRWNIGKASPSLSFGPRGAQVTVTMAAEVIDRLREKQGPLVTQAVIRETLRVGESPSWKQPVITYAPDSPGAEDFAALAKELSARKWPRS